jgi:hypothetical protein
MSTSSKLQRKQANPWHKLKMFTLFFFIGPVGLEVTHYQSFEFPVQHGVNDPKYYYVNMDMLRDSRSYICFWRTMIMVYIT